MESLSKEKLEELFARFLENECSEEEVSLLMQQFKTGKNKKILGELVRQHLAQEPVRCDYSEEINKVYSLIERHIQQTSQKQNVRLLWRKIAVAASIIFVLVIGGVWFVGKKEKENTPVAIKQNEVKDFSPGREKAVLQLANGSAIMLDSAQNGTLANQGNTSITKLSNGQLVYSAGGKPAEMLYNSIVTPKGGTYKITLADGTKAWLNAASSLRFPTAFKGNERIVEVEGEVYFEVAHNVSMPFMVKNGNVTVKVLGTNFNVNSYADERNIKVTLLEGKVKVFSSGERKSVDITPGQQAVVNPASNNVSVTNNVNMESVMAWKNDLFYFDNADIKTIMRQIGRWYNIEVEMKGEIPERAFSGKISRNTNASNVLKILEQSNIHFKIEDKKIVLMP
jgi:ferric-dicitrate binding protein FerR (iron transport regulator)